MKIETAFTKDLGIDLPILVAPMFLVSGPDMLIAAAEHGAIGAVPTLNFRTTDLLKEGFQKIRVGTKKPYGANLIVQKTNPYAKEHLKVCLDLGVPFYITSLGNPKEVITEAHKNGAKVYCDVTNMEFAQKVVDLGADGLIAVCAGAGGHAGEVTPIVFIPALKERFKIPVVAAGGVVGGKGMAAMLALGADAVSVGTRFIASKEAPVNNQYKEAIVKAKVEDIVYTEKISGTPCSVIQTPYVKKWGLKQNMFERFLSNNRSIRKYYKMLVQYRGMKLMDRAAQVPTYKDVWCAGQSSGLIHDVKPVGEILQTMIEEYSATVKILPKVDV